MVTQGDKLAFMIIGFILAALLLTGAAVMSLLLQTGIKAIPTGLSRLHRGDSLRVHCKNLVISAGGLALVLIVLWLQSQFVGATTQDLYGHHTVRNNHVAHHYYIDGNWAVGVGVTLATVIAGYDLIVTFIAINQYRRWSRDVRVRTYAIAAPAFSKN